jgi:hypothetical protein
MQTIEQLNNRTMEFMKKLGDFLLPALARKGLGKEARSALICFLANKYADGRFSAISFSRGVLRVSVTSSAAAQMVQMEEEKIIAHLNGEMKRECVKSVRIVNVG